MSIFIPYFIAGICAAGFVTIWFWNVYTELSAKRNCLNDLDEQLCLFERLYVQARSDSDMHSVTEMLETSKMLYREASKNYNQILNKPMNRVPALLMGFRQAKEEGV